MQEIIITISKAVPVIKVKGILGTSCKGATADLEKALGKVTSDKPTDEMQKTGGQQHAALH